MMKLTRLQKATRAILQQFTRKQLPPSPAHTLTEYMTCLTLANAGRLDPGTVDCFDYAIKNLPRNAPIVEIGPLCGLSTNMITHCKERYAVKNALIACSQWIFEGAGSGHSLEGYTGISFAGE